MNVRSPVGIVPASGNTVPTITSGTGAPSAAEPNGSVYLRLDGGVGTTLYVRYSSTWVAVVGTDAEIAALAAAATGLSFVDLQAAAEAGNAIAVTVQLKDVANANLARAQRLHCRLYDASMLEAVVGSWTMAETGAGTEISTTARPALLVDTDANGAAVVTVTDVSGTFAGTVYLEVVPVIVPGSVEPGVPAIIALTFA